MDLARIIRTVVGLLYLSVGLSQSPEQEAHIPAPFVARRKQPGVGPTKIAFTRVDGRHSEEEEEEEENAWDPNRKNRACLSAAQSLNNPEGRRPSTLVFEQQF